MTKIFVRHDFVLVIERNVSHIKVCIDNKRDSLVSNVCNQLVVFYSAVEVVVRNRFNIKVALHEVLPAWLIFSDLMHDESIVERNFLASVCKKTCFLIA